MKRNQYETPLSSRYASKDMSFIWSPQMKFSTWRRLWLALAKAQKELGLPISDQQVDEMEAHLNDINFSVAENKEKELHHDVMSHIYAFAQQCPNAKPILHLGATSCFITDNTELIQMKKSLQLIQQQLLCLISHLRELALGYKALPTLGYTHYQPAQLTTVGKRFSLWLQDFFMDFKSLDQAMYTLPFRGVKGATGTQASFLTLFDGDHKKVEQLDKRVSELMGFRNILPICAQTYTRKIDFNVLSILAGIGQSSYKMAADIRLLSNLQELEEPFEVKQVGSSAMAYKRNPVRSERICALARFLNSLLENSAHTHANQWLERSLDDSANRRLVLPQAFLTVDSILLLANNVISGLILWPRLIEKHIQKELPFISTENILMLCVKAGGDRQELHEALRQYSMEVAERMKKEGVDDNDLLTRILQDSRFASVHEKLATLVDPKNFIGRAPEQVESFIVEVIDPLLNMHRESPITVEE